MGLLAEAVELHESVRDPFGRARALLALGVTRRRARQKRPAREAIEQALSGFEELGPANWAARARQELGAIGGRTRAEGLTPAERRVADLVAKGARTRRSPRRSSSPRGRLRATSPASTPSSASDRGPSSPASSRRTRPTYRRSDVPASARVRGRIVRASPSHRHPGNESHGDDCEHDDRDELERPRCRRRARPRARTRSSPSAARRAVRRPPRRVRPRQASGVGLSSTARAGGRSSVASFVVAHAEARP